MTDLAGELGRILKSKVIDETGLKAKYEFMLTFAGGFGRGAPVYAVMPSEDSSVGGAASSTVPFATDPLPDIFGALQSQLGLRLEKKKVPAQVMVIDHVEKNPAGN